MVVVEPGGGLLEVDLGGADVVVRQAGVAARGDGTDVGCAGGTLAGVNNGCAGEGDEGGESV